MFESVAHHVEAAENRISQLRDAIATHAAEVEVLKGIVAAAQRVFANPAEQQNGKPSESVQRRHAIQKPKERRLGIAEDVVSYLSGKEDGVTVDMIAESINCTKQQVSQALVAGKKKGRFKIVSRGVWAIAKGTP